MYTQLAECPSPCLTHCASNSSSCSLALPPNCSFIRSHPFNCSQVRSVSGTPVGSRTHRGCCDCRTTPSRRTRPAPFLDARVRLRRSFHVGFSAARSELNFRRASFLCSVDTVSWTQPRAPIAGLFRIVDASSSFRAGCGSTTAQPDTRLGKVDTSCKTPSPPPAEAGRHETASRKSVLAEKACVALIMWSAQFQSFSFGRGGACGAPTTVPGSRPRIA